MVRPLALFLALAAGLASLGGCGRQAAPAATPPREAGRTEAPSPQPPPPRPPSRREAAAPVVRGTVVEVLDAGRATYALVEADGDRAWVAAPAVALAVGDVVELSTATAVRNHESVALGRTFDEVYLGSSVRVVARGTPPAGAPSR